MPCGFSTSLSGKLPAANAAAPLMPSGDLSQRGKSHYGLIAGALFLARGGYAERLARPPTVFGYMPAMADRRLPPGNRCRRCCRFPERDCRKTQSTLSASSKESFIGWWFCLMLAVSPSSLPQRCDAVQFALPSDFPHAPADYCVYRTSSNWQTLCYCGSPEALGGMWLDMFNKPRLEKLVQCLR